MKKFEILSLSTRCVGWSHFHTYVPLNSTSSFALLHSLSFCPKRLTTAQNYELQNVVPSVNMTNLYAVSHTYIACPLTFHESTFIAMYVYIVLNHDWPNLRTKASGLCIYRIARLSKQTYVAAEIFLTIKYLVDNRRFFMLLFHLLINNQCRHFLILYRAICQLLSETVCYLCLWLRLSYPVWAHLSALLSNQSTLSVNSCLEPPVNSHLSIPVRDHLYLLAPIRDHLSDSACMQYVFLGVLLRNSVCFSATELRSTRWFVFTFTVFLLQCKQ